MPSTTVTVALAGNPNSGKTCLFNALTGSRQHVGNYPGVTVEYKRGRCRQHDRDLDLIDLPGTYSLACTSEEERVARRFLTEERPDVVIDVVDASNLERHLYLALQLLELGVPLVLALNMHDVATQRGIRIDIQALSERLAVPVIPTVATRREGLEPLLAAAMETARAAADRRQRHHHPAEQARIEYDRRLERTIECLTADVVATAPDLRAVPARWYAIKLLEGDEEVTALPTLAPLETRVLCQREELARIYKDTADIVMADKRYAVVADICHHCVRGSDQLQRHRSERLDDILTHRWLGLPIFFALMYAVFHFTFTVGEIPMGWIETGFGALADQVRCWWPPDSPSLLRALLLDGIIGGVGGVVMFVPNIALLFLAISLLESTGYMTRAAFIMDRAMHKLGLHGKSFIPMLLGFGCTVPAILATRTLESRRDRLTTILVLPLMSCGARFPIYALIIPVFFAHHRGLVLFAIYLIGIVLAVCCARLLRSTVFRGEPPPFLMELPPYRTPVARDVLLDTGHRVWLYLRKAGTVILAISVVLWALTTFPRTDPSPAQADRAEAIHRTWHEETGRVLANHLDPQQATIARQALARRQRFRQERGDAPDHHPALDELRHDLHRDLDRLIRQAPWLADFLAAYDTIAQQRFGDAAATPPDPAVYHPNLDSLAISDPHHAAALAVVDGPRTRYRIARRELAAAVSERELTHTVAGRLGSGLEPLLTPMGFDWRIGTALIGAFAAKEVFVAQMGIVFAAGDTDHDHTDLQHEIRNRYTPLIGFCIMLFCLISAPCMATIAVTRRETGSWRWAALQLGGLTAIAWILTTAVYQIGTAIAAGG